MSVTLSARPLDLAVKGLPRRGRVSDDCRHKFTIPA
jgi:hypothetical protein